jgi:hypothetical protein
MSEGLDANGKLYLYRNIVDDAERTRYWRLKLKDSSDAQPVETDAVQLTCAACHRLDASDFGAPGDQLAGLPQAAVLPPRAAGAAILPITYENQCKACHPLTFDKTAAVPHRLQPDKVREYLESYFTLKLLESKSTLFDKNVSRRHIPGKPPDEEMVKASERIKAQADAIQKLLYQGKAGCAECHYGEPEGQLVPARIAPTNVPTIWLPHAKFNHTIHRVVDCESCHEGVRDSKTSADVLLPGIETCQQCHAPPSRTRGGARFDCTECHRYHHGDTPLRGLGTEKRDPEIKRTIEEVLGD